MLRQQILHFKETEEAHAAQERDRRGTCGTRKKQRRHMRHKKETEEAHAAQERDTGGTCDTRKRLKQTKNILSGK
jgi:hypothetical protein